MKAIAIEAMNGCLLGGALGDSIGLPFEGMNARRIAKVSKKPLEQSLFFGRGMVSDDTEHAVMTLLCLNECDTDPATFSRFLGKRFQWWFAGLPAGIGLGTARSIIKLWFGVSPGKSGSSSAGNGPMMRAAVIGVRFADRPELRRKFVDASTLITHRDARAVEGARLIAECAAMAVGKVGTPEIVTKLSHLVESDEMRERFSGFQEALTRCVGVKDFADSFGRKKGMVSGFAPDTAAVGIYAWLKYRDDFRKGVEEIVFAGGDTDTVAFVAGSLIGIEVGVRGLPASWRRGLRDAPIEEEFLKRISGGELNGYPKFPLSIPRNIFFLLIVIGHGVRRLFPPY